MLSFRVSTLLEMPHCCYIILFIVEDRRTEIGLREDAIITSHNFMLRDCLRWTIRAAREQAQAIARQHCLNCLYSFHHRTFATLISRYFSHEGQNVAPS